LFFVLLVKKKKRLFRNMSGLGSCCADPGAKQTHQTQGHEEQIAGVNTYKTGDGKSAIVIFTDIFGSSFVNIQKVADTVAQGTQATVLIPDCFNGDPIDPNTPDIMGALPAWIKKHPPADACALAEKVISTIKGHYQSIQVIESIIILCIFYLFFLSGDGQLLWR
jgi:dienelactone hydrolase